MPLRIDAAALSLTACLLSGAAALADPTITEFDGPGADSTYVSGIGKGGDISGLYVKDGAATGYILHGDGSFLFLDGSSYPQAINASGETAGDTQDKNAFVASADGTVTTFLPPGAGKFGATAFAIDAKGDVAGTFVDDKVVSHGFLRGKGGDIVTFDAPGASTKQQSGTYVTALASGGIVAGYALDDKRAGHGFLRAADGSFTVIEVDGAGGGSHQGTQVLCVSANGITGGFYKNSNRAFHAFVRDGAGNVTTFDVPGAQNTVVTGVNNKGAAVGTYNSGGGPTHGFERLPSGHIVTIDAPDAGSASDGGTFPTGINDRGEIAGYYIGTDDNQHGFFRTKS
ncbi:MAG TPA: hypothetical protein VFV07_07680 [Rhizomicrobium sp.]|nr:hypothetical protein [Rhizomicrobium sp.]